MGILDDIIGIIGGITGGGSDAEDAHDDQARANREAALIQRKTAADTLLATIGMYQQQREDIRPWREVGLKALNTIDKGMEAGVFTNQQWKPPPMYGENTPQMPSWFGEGTQTNSYTKYEPPDLQRFEWQSEIPEEWKDKGLGLEALKELESEARKPPITDGYLNPNNPYYIGHQNNWNAQNETHRKKAEQWELEHEWDAENETWVNRSTKEPVELPPDGTGLGGDQTAANGYLNPNNPYYLGEQKNWSNQNQRDRDKARRWELEHEWDEARQTWINKSTGEPVDPPSDGTGLGRWGNGSGSGGGGGGGGGGSQRRSGTPYFRG